MNYERVYSKTLIKFNFFFMLRKCLEELIDNDDYDVDNNKKSTSSTKQHIILLNRIIIPKL